MCVCVSLCESHTGLKLLLPLKKNLKSLEGIFLLKGKAFLLPLLQQSFPLSRSHLLQKDSAAREAQDWSQRSNRKQDTSSLGAQLTQTCGKSLRDGNFPTYSQTTNCHVDLPSSMALSWRLRNMRRRPLSLESIIWTELSGENVKKHSAG